MSGLRWHFSVLWFALLAGTACTSTFARVQHAEVLYQEQRYDDAKVVLDDIEGRSQSLQNTEVALYHYLLGMLADRAHDSDASLYHLSIAREVAGERGDGLSPNQRTTLAQTLTRLESARFASPD